MTNSLVDKARKIKLAAFDFDGVFTDNTVYCFADGSEAVRCWRSDGIGLHKLEAAGVKCIIISQEPNEIVMKRAHKLSIPCYITSDKLTCLGRIAGEMGIGLDAVCFVGNDEPDIPCLEAVGLAFLSADGYSIRKLPRLTRPGGKGAVREVCDFIIGAKASAT